VIILISVNIHSLSYANAFAKSIHTLYYIQILSYIFHFGTIFKRIHSLVLP